MRILLAEDHHVVRKGLRTLLDRRADLEVVAEAADGHAAVELALEHSPDVVVMDTMLPGLNGAEATRRILAVRPEVRVVALSGYCDHVHVSRMLAAGAVAYLVKDCGPHELERAVRAAAMGQTYLDSTTAELIVDRYHQTRRVGHDRVEALLSSREREALQLLSEGHSTKDIAHIMGVSDKTVESHRRQMMIKLDIHSVAGLTKFALREGLTGL